MASRLNRCIQITRDLVIAIASILIIASSYGKWHDEPAHYILFGTANLFLMLTIVNLILVISNEKGRVFFYFNTILQTVLTSLLMLVMLPFGGIILAIPLAMDIAILATLRKKKGHEG